MSTGFVSGASAGPVNVQYAAPMGGSPGPIPEGIPAGAKFQGSIQRGGAVIDQYRVDHQTTVPVRQVVPEVQNYQVTTQRMVPETQHIQVPTTKMVAVEETVMVPQVRMVPKKQMKRVPQTQMVTQTITTQRPVQTVETRQRTIAKVVEQQQILKQDEYIEYERPRMIAGSKVREYMGPTQTVGVTSTGYSQAMMMGYGQQQQYGYTGGYIGNAGYTTGSVMPMMYGQYGYGNAGMLGAYGTAGMIGGSVAPLSPVAATTGVSPVATTGISPFLGNYSTIAGYGGMSNAMYGGAVATNPLPF